MTREEQIRTLPFRIQKPVQKLNENGDVIEEYESGKQAARIIGRSRPALCLAIKNGYKCGGYYWKHKKSNFNHLKTI